MHLETKLLTSFSANAMAVRQILSINNEADKGVALESMHKGQIHTMFELFVSYCVLDHLAAVEGIPSPVAVPKQTRYENLGNVDRKVYLNGLTRSIFDFFEGVASHGGLEGSVTKIPGEYCQYATRASFTDAC